jgi:TPP-dependent pyruvate/acetoin dehydrogenase alpha subunit
MQDLVLTESLYEKMLLVRTFENKVLELFSKGKLFGTTHAYIGQEANGAGVISTLKDDDIVVSNHRCHGHYLIFKNNPYALLCEMMGKEDGLCGGRGGSQHICDGNFFSNGVQGGILPLSAGLAFAEKEKKSTKIVTVFIGDGTLGEGVVYEILNIVAKWELPLLIVVENNRYAQSTKIEKTLAGDISARFKSFGIQTKELSTFDATEIYESSKKMVNNIREDTKPGCLVLNTYRFASHSKSDDGRDEKEIKSWLSNDPLIVFDKFLSKDFIDEKKENITKEIDRVVELALDAPFAK